MEETYSGKELMKAFGVSKDALFYYEKIGLLSPLRNPENNYRMYTEKDVLTLHEIKNMTSLGFSLSEIRDYTSNHNISATLNNLDAEIEKLNASIKYQTALKQSIENKKATIIAAENISSLSRCSLVHEKEKRLLLLSNHDLTLTEFFMEVGKFESKYENAFSFLGCSDVYEFPIVKSKENPIPEINRILLYSEEENFPHNFTLPEGDYVKMYYKGDYSESIPSVKKIISYIKRKHMKIESPLYAFFRISDLETDLIEENIIEYVIRVSI